MKDNKKYLIIAIFTIAIVFFGGTLAYWQWETSTGQQTSVTFTVENNFKCSVDGGGDITSSNITLAPSTCTNSKYAIKREITTDVDITGSNMSVLMDLWLDVNSIDPELKNSTNFKYAITTNSNSCTEGYINGGTFTGTTAQLLDNKIYSGSKEEKYYLYVWLDSEETNLNTQNKSFSLSLNGSCTSASISDYKETILNGADPVLESGMIPVTIADNGDVTTADLTQEWYSYSNKEWANAVLVNSDNRMNYYNTDGTIKGNQPVTDSDILAYFVWIPRYKYAFPKSDGSPETISIIFENNQTSKSKGTAKGTSYYTHPAFTFGNDELNGIWVGKFETTGSATIPTILPNVSSLRGYNDAGLGEFSDEGTYGIITMLTNSSNKNNITNLDLDYSLTNISDYFKVSLKFAGGTLNGSAVTFTGNNTYGLTANTNTHMMKNSEWGAVAYLSHSAYGIGEEIRINNNSGYITGCGASSINGVSTSVCQIEYGTPSNEKNSYPQSTTGNISGIFDMSGGASEYVMGIYAEKISGGGFSTLPESKYYDLYPSSVFTKTDSTNTDLCTLETCGGHALYETSSWYSDYVYFVNSDAPWFHRGGKYKYGSGSGIFHFNHANGKVYEEDSWHLVLVAEKGA